MHSMKIKRPLPPSPPTATKTVHNNHIYGYGRHTYEYNESAPVVFSLKEISAALKRVESRYCTEITKGLTSAGADDRDIQLMTNMASEVIEEVQKELIGGRNTEQSLSG